ncbi:MAG: helix-turn-helix domain-containing protein [Prevotella sp.]|nr:helix-turn-helix domain-containing protein [Prevotella sp.]
MAKIKNEQEYRKLLERIDQLLEVVNDDTPTNDINFIELNLISDLVEEYEDIRYPIGKPSLVDVIKLRLYETGITQSKLAEMLGISPSRVSELLNGKSEPTLKIGRELCRQLDINPSVVLGV